MDFEERIAGYISSLLRNPEYLKSVFQRYGNGTSASKEQLATAIADLEQELWDKLQPEMGGKVK